MMTSIDSLPDDCLRCIFGHLHLVEQLPLLTVCPRWTTLLEHLFASKHSLKIFPSNFEVYRRMDSVIKYELHEKPDFAIRRGPGSSDEVILLNQLPVPFTNLPVLFPAVHRLLIDHCTTLYAGAELLQTISQWSSLKHLSFFGIPDPAVLTPSFWPILNTFSHLETLNLGHLASCTVPETLSLLHNLTSFTVVSYRYDLEPIISQLEAVRVLNLSTVFFTSEQLERILEKNTKLTENLTQLGLDFINCRTGRCQENFLKLFQIICKRFVNLEFLCILFGDDIPFNELFSNLQHLSHLRQLRFHLRGDQLPPSYRLQNIPRLPSIENLFIETSNITSESILHIFPWVFPNLKVFKLKVDLKESESNTLQTGLGDRLPQLEQLSIIHF